jgi:hypothetical protein
MINLKAAAKTAMLVGVIGLGIELITSFPEFFLRMALTIGGIWAISVIYRWFDEQDENK